MINAYIAILDATPNTIRIWKSASASINFQKPAAKFLPFGLVNKQVRILGGDLFGGAKFGEQLPREGEHRRLSRGLVWHEDSSVARNADKAADFPRWRAR